MLLEAHFGVPLAGGVLVPINTRLSAPEIGYILAHSGARAMLIDTELTPLLATVREDCPDLNTIVTSADSATDSVVDGIDYESFLQTGKDDAGSPPLTDENAPISINYTSGTTGKPKGVICTHRGAYLNALSVALELRMGPDSVYLWTLPMFHCNGWCCTWGATAVGATYAVAGGTSRTQATSLTLPAKFNPSWPAPVAASGIQPRTSTTALIWYGE